MASKKIFDVNSTAKKFLSGIENTEPQPKENKIVTKEPSGKIGAESNYLPVGKEIGANRPKSVDKETGEVTKQIGYFVTTSQDSTLRELAGKMNTNKSTIVRKALAMYFDYLKKEGVL